MPSYGFDGKVDEQRFAQMWQLGPWDSTATTAAYALTQGSGRQVSVAPGMAFAKGILSIESAARTVNLSPPSSGGLWYCIVRRLNWATNTETIVAVPHTTTVTQQIPAQSLGIFQSMPTSYPTLNNQPGTLYDHVLGWAWVRAQDTVVRIQNTSMLPGGVIDHVLFTNGDFVGDAFQANGSVILRRRAGMCSLSGEMLLQVATGSSALRDVLSLPFETNPISLLRGGGIAFGSNSTTEQYELSALGSLRLTSNTIRTNAPGYNLGGVAPWAAASWRG